MKSNENIEAAKTHCARLRAALQRANHASDVHLSDELWASLREVEKELAFYRYGEQSESGR